MGNRLSFHCLIAGVLVLLAACTPVQRLPSSSGAQDTAESLATTPARALPALDRWQELREWSPYPHTTPLPPQAPTPLDGLYVRLDPRTQARIPCRRCPPYPPEGGVWMLEFDAGVFRVYHPRTGWRTLGSYTVNGDQVTLFNDPQCHLAVGRFTWAHDDAGLRFALLEDDCELGTRAKNFTAQIWESCRPPNHEAAVTGHWPAPEGCDLTGLQAAPTPTKSPTLSQ